MHTITVIVGKPIIKSRLVYVLDFLKNHPLSPDGVGFVIEEGEGRGAEVVFKGKKYAPDELLGELPDLPSESKSNSEDEVYFKGVGCKFFETIFFHISRYEEVFCEKTKLDLHGRMKSEEMFLVKNGLEKSPVIDKLVFGFFEKLGLNPKRSSTEYHMSHDIDILLKFPSGKKIIKAFASMILKQRSGRGFIKLIRQYFRFLLKLEKDPFDTYDWLFSDKNFKTKTVYVLPEGTVPKIEKHFKLKEPKVMALLNTAKLRGYEIGLHPSYNAGIEQRLFLKEKEKLESAVGKKLNRNRQHFLRWDFAKTPRIIENLGLESDSTLGFSDRIGFRCGTGFPYRLYDFENEKPFDFFEVPLVVMDVSLLREAKNPKEFLANFLNQNKENTAITFNFHNSTFDEVYVQSEELKDLYLSINSPD